MGNLSPPIANANDKSKTRHRTEMAGSVRNRPVNVRRDLERLPGFREVSQDRCADRPTAKDGSGRKRLVALAGAGINPVTNPDQKTLARKPVERAVGS